MLGQTICNIFCDTSFFPLAPHPLITYHLPRFFDVIATPSDIFGIFESLMTIMGNGVHERKVKICCKITLHIHRIILAKATLETEYVVEISISPNYYCCCFTIDTKHHIINAVSQMKLLIWKFETRTKNNRFHKLPPFRSHVCVINNRLKPSALQHFFSRHILNVTQSPWHSEIN